jgi:prepilin-type N-terminal cleavage/methylation domain-containing protein
MNKRVAPPTNPETGEKRGFTIVELLVALVILTVGILAVALLSGQFGRQVNISDMSVGRSSSLQAAIEEIRATPFADVATGEAMIDEYEVSWTVLSSSDTYKEIQIITVGPGMARPEGGGAPVITQNVPDTFNYRLLSRPDIRCEDGRVIASDDDDDDSDGSADDDDDSDAADLCAAEFPDDDDDDDDSGGCTSLMHFPPGNPANEQEICVGGGAVNAHLNNHGDTLITN